MSTTTGEETLKNCPFCGGYHNGTCPSVEEIEYYENGTIKRVKFKDPTTFQSNDIRETQKDLESKMAYWAKRSNPWSW